MAAESFRSLIALWRYRVESTPENDAFYGRVNGSWSGITWREADRRASDIAAGLLALGVKTGERCAILCRTRPEWLLCDLGILLAGAATTTLYTMAPANSCRFVVEQSQSGFCFVEDPGLAERLEGVPDCRRILITGQSPREGDLTLDEVETLGRRRREAEPGELDAVAEAIGPQDLATLMYTSGTTGEPAGVELTHANWVFEGEAMERLGILGPTDRHYLFLPLSHAFAKALALASIRGGVRTYVDGDVESLPQNLKAARPTVMAVVPRMLERSRDRILGYPRGAAQQKAFDWALETGFEVSRQLQKGRRPRGLLAARHRVAERTILSTIRSRYGGSLRYFISGGAPLPLDLAEFFHAVGLLVLEGYGLTESTAASLVNRPDAWRLGTVGKPLQGVDMRLADDGELLLGGGGIMRGYHGRPEATASVLTEDGFLRTGDIASIDDDGFVRITGRKKDLIVTSSGKNIVPTRIETALAARSPFVSHVVLHGDRRPYCVALVALEPAEARRWATENGRSTDLESLAKDPELEKLILRDVQALNAELASFESIRKIALLPGALSIEDEELTPTLKVRRAEVARKHAALLDRLYEEG